MPNSDLKPRTILTTDEDWITIKKVARGNFSKAIRIIAKGLRKTEYKRGRPKKTVSN